MSLEVHLVTPEREIWTGQAEMLIARGVDGELGILGGHQPMLVQLAIGFLHVGTHEGITRADVLASQAVLASEIDVEQARRTLAELESRGAELEEAELEVLKLEMRKAQARVKLAG